MTDKKKEYRRLPGRHKNFAGGLSTLWQGKDHLLSIAYTFGTERYKRFYYRDIQAFIIRKTALGKIQNLILAALTVLSGLIAFAAGEIGAGIFGALSAAMLLILLVNVWRGPTCECLIQTAVQKEKLQNFYRFKTAVKALAMIAPLLQNVQGRLAVEDLRSAWQSAPAKETAARKPPAAGPANRRLRRLHLMFFSTLLALGLLTGLLFFRQNMALVMAETVLGLAAAILLIPALVHQHQSQAAKTVRVITWVSLGYMAAYLLSGYVVYMFIAFKQPMIVYDQWQVLKLAAGLSPQSHPLLFAINAFASIGALILGLGGLLMLRRS